MHSVPSLLDQASLTSFELVVVSDIHLIDQDDERGILLLKLLLNLPSPNLRYLILLGDIFDFCFGSSYFESKYKNIALELNRIAQTGVKVLFFQGNHEFGIERLRWPGVDFVIQPYRIITLSAGIKVALCHGDQLAAPWHYYLYCRIVRSAIFQTLVAWLPNIFLDRLCLAVSAKSRMRNRKRRIPHRRILGGASHWLKDLGCRFGIMGHYHVPYYYRLPKQKIDLLCLDSWDKPNLLGYDGKDFKRVYFN